MKINERSKLSFSFRSCSRLIRAFQIREVKPKTKIVSFAWCSRRNYTLMIELHIIIKRKHCFLENIEKPLIAAVRAENLCLFLTVLSINYQHRIPCFTKFSPKISIRALVWFLAVCLSNTIFDWLPLVPEDIIIL